MAGLRDLHGMGAGGVGEVVVMRYGSLFTGIGGFDLGFDRAGIACAWQVEKDKHCRALLDKRWPDAKKYEDVTNVGKDLEPVELICGGFPCQDVSISGRRKGLAGKRSGLWFEFLRIIKTLRPEWVVIENVPGLLSSNSGRDMGTILGGLGKCGYWWAYRVLDAQYFGVPQRRRRVFIVASLTKGRPQEVLFERESSPWDTPPSREKGEDFTIYACKQSQTGSNGLGIKQDTRDEVRLINGDGQIAGALASQPGTKQQNYLAFGGNNKEPLSVATSCNAHGSGRYDFESETFICNTFNGYTGGADDNDAQGWHLVPALSGTLGNGSGNRGWKVSAENAADGHLVCWNGDTTPKTSNGVGLTLKAEQGGEGVGDANTFGVRRFTPLECERLQGFPDNWTAGQSDSQRYRQLGNAVAVPVAEWLGHRLVRLWM